MEHILDYVNILAIPGLSAIVLALVFKVARHYVMKIEDERLRTLLLELVKAAEQIYGKGNGATKLAYVREQARRQGVSEADLGRVEAAVYDLRQAQVC